MVRALAITPDTTNFITEWRSGRKNDGHIEKENGLKAIMGEGEASHERIELKRERIRLQVNKKRCALKSAPQVILLAEKWFSTGNQTVPFTDNFRFMPVKARKPTADSNNVPPASGTEDDPPSPTIT